MNTISEAIKAERHKLGLSLADVAEEAGVSRAYVNALELGKDNAVPQGVASILSALGLTLMVARVGQVKRDHLRVFQAETQNLVLDVPGLKAPMSSPVVAFGVRPTPTGLDVGGPLDTVKGRVWDYRLEPGMTEDDVLSLLNTANAEHGHATVVQVFTTSRTKKAQRVEVPHVHAYLQHSDA